MTNKRPHYSYTISGYTANQVYNTFNRRWFMNKLPKIPVRWPQPYPKNANYIGLTKGTRERPLEIWLNPEFKDSSRVWGQTLLHEMVHIEQWGLPSSQAHGRKFHRRMRQLAAQGAFEPFW